MLKKNLLSIAVVSAAMSLAACSNNETAEVETPAEVEAPMTADQDMTPENDMATEPMVETDPMADDMDMEATQTR